MHQLLYILIPNENHKEPKAAKYKEKRYRQ